MPTRNKELTFGSSSATIEPDAEGSLPTFDELKSLLGDEDDVYLNDGQLQEDLDAAIMAGTRKRAKRKVGQRLRQERERLDKQVAMLAETDPAKRGVNPYLTDKQNAKLLRDKADTEANIQALELAREQLNLSTSQLIRDEMDGQPLATRAATLAQENLKPEVARLLASLNMNVDLSLNGRQTELLMSTLLACNEHQIQAILDNDKVPMSVKLMAKRLKDDLKAGSTTALEGLWDRIFGKGILDINGQAAEYRRSLSAGSKSQPASQTVVNLGGNTQIVNGRVVHEDTNRLLHDAALPDQPLSREAYQLIRQRFAAEEAEYEDVTASPSPTRPHSSSPRPSSPSVSEYEEYIDQLNQSDADRQEADEERMAKDLEELL